MTVTSPKVTATAAATNGPQMRVVLDAQQDARTLGDRITAAPAALKGWFRAAIKALRLDGAASAAAGFGRYIWDRIVAVAGFAKGFGISNLIGAVITTPLRHTAVKVAKTVAKVVTAPIRWAWRAVRWGLNFFGWGRMVVQQVEATVAKATAKVDQQVQRGLNWLDSKDQHGAMNWLRWFFQANVIRKAVSLLLPGFPGWAVYAITLCVPMYGDKQSPAEEAAIERAKEVLADIPDRPKTAAAEAVADAAEAPKGRPTPKQQPARTLKTEEVVAVVDESTVKLETAVLKDTDLEEGKQTFEVQSFVLPGEGVRRYRVGSQLLLEEDLPDNMSVVHGVTIDGEPLVPHPVESVVRRAQATPNGRPPTLPRAARRQKAPRKAASK